MIGITSSPVIIGCRRETPKFDVFGVGGCHLLSLQKGACFDDGDVVLGLESAKGLAGLSYIYS